MTAQFSTTPNVDEVFVIRHADGSLTWTWRGDTGLVLMSRELLDQILADLSAYGVMREQARTSTNWLVTH